MWSWWPHSSTLFDSPHDCSVRMTSYFLEILILGTTVSKAIILLLSFLNLLKSFILLECLVMFPWFQIKRRRYAAVSRHWGWILWALSLRHSTHARPTHTWLTHAWCRPSKLIFHIIVKLFYSLIPKITHTELKQLFLNSLNKATFPFVLLFDMPVFNSLYFQFRLTLIQSFIF